MKKLFVAAFSLLICLIQNLFGQVHLTGNIRALGNSDIIIEYYEGNVQKSITLKAIDGKFIWQAPVTESQKITIVFPGRATYLFVDPGNMTITGSRDSVETLKVTGSPTNDEAVAYAQSIRGLEERQDALYKSHDKLSPEQEFAREEEYNSITAKKKAIIYEYINTHRGSALSLNLVTEYSTSGIYEDVSKMYNSLSEKIKATSEGKRLAERLEILKHSAIGQKMMAFTQKNEKGKLISFSDFKGKYVLVDFWASWCAPCRMEIPNLIKMYNLYNTKNFTIVSISLDDDDKSWQNALTVFNMPWTQIRDLSGFDNPLAVYYGIVGIPSTLLIDPNGVIITKDLRGIALSKKLKEILEHN